LCYFYTVVDERIARKKRQDIQFVGSYILYTMTEPFANQEAQTVCHQCVDCHRRFDNELELVGYSETEIETQLEAIVHTMRLEQNGFIAETDAIADVNERLKTIETEISQFKSAEFAANNENLDAFILSLLYWWNDQIRGSSPLAKQLSANFISRYDIPKRVRKALLEYAAKKRDMRNRRVPEFKEYHF